MNLEEPSKEEEPKEEKKITGIRIRVGNKVNLGGVVMNVSHVNPGKGRVTLQSPPGVKVIDADDNPIVAVNATNGGTNV